MQKTFTTPTVDNGGTRKRRIGSFVLFLFLLIPMFIGGTTSLGQTALSVLRGTVTDESGAALPSVVITVTDLTTSIKVRTITTDGNGNFEIPDLKLGSYRLNAEKTGFRAYVADNLVIDAGQTRRLDISLQVGQATDSVTVEAGAALITKETGTISGEIDKRKFTDQPTVDVYPSPLSMLTTLPGIQGNGWNIVISGVSDRNKQTWAMDGVANDTAGDQNDNPAFYQTVQVTTVTPGADSARSVNFNMVSKRGGDQFHGQVFYRHFNSGLNSRDFFAPRRSPYIQHEWEGELSGPIWKEHTQFYVAWFHQSIPLSSSIQRNVPTAQMRQGNFSQFGAITDPLTGKPFPGNIIPADRINPVSQAIQDRFYPAPNLGGPTTLTNNFNWQFPYNTDLYKGDWPFVRIDHKLTNNNNLFVRWAQRKTPYIRPGGTPDLTWTQARDHRQMVISDTHIFSPNLINTFTFGRQTDFLLIGEEEKGVTTLFGDDVVKSLGIQGVNQGNFHTQGFPNISISGGLGSQSPVTLSSNNGGLGNIDVDNGLNTYIDSLTWSKGKHVLKFGGEYRQLWQFSGNISSQVYGNFNFNGVYTGIGYADFLLGLPQTSTRLNPVTNRKSSNKQVGFFVSDTFKISQKLTIDYGLRWDYYATPTYNDGLMANFDPATGNVVVAPGTLSRINPAYPTNLIKVVEGKVVPVPDKRNLRPRISAAYRIGDNTVVRGGYGEYSETWGYFSLPSSAPFQFSESYIGTKTQPLPAFPNAFPLSASAALASQSITGLPLQTDNGVIRQFNVSLEREWHDIGLRASYIGSRGSGLNYSLNINKPEPSTTAFAQSRRPYPQFNGVTMTRTDGQTRYDSLQVAANRRMRSFTFNVSWTFSNSLYNYANTENPYNVTSLWARDAANRRNYLDFYTIWEVPVGRNRHFLSKAPAVVNHLIGGWNLQTISYFGSGQYFSPAFNTVDPSNTNSQGGLPDRIGDGNLSGDARTKTRWFDPSAFKIPGCPDSKPLCSSSERQNVGRFGNSGVNILEGQGLNVHHVSVAKTFPFTEQWKMTLTGEISNLFNHQHFNNPNNNISNANPGQFTSTIPNYNPEKQSYRQVALKLRIEF
jgi:carboxypeptidase family protein